MGNNRALALGEHEDGTLDAVCHCGRQFVRLTPEQVRAGESVACTRPECLPGCELLGDPARGRPPKPRPLDVDAGAE